MASRGESSASGAGLVDWARIGRFALKIRFLARNNPDLITEVKELCTSIAQRAFVFSRGKPKF